LANFGRGSFNLGQVVAKWSPPLQIWHLPNTVEEDDVSGIVYNPLEEIDKCVV